jgi:LPXTG-site transpeptidase (sortase) family protein
MRSNISSTWSIIIGAVVLVCTGAVVFFIPPNVQGQYSTGGSPVVAVVPTVAPVAVSASSPSQTVGIPARLIIPAINIDTTIAPAGLVDGAMGVPVGPTSTTWFDLGPRPGQIGSAVIAGHEGWKDGIFAIFDNLHELRPGDEIYVVDDQGATTTFVVQTLQLYSQNANASSVFTSNDGLAHLNLITCEGTWNAAEKSYSDRLVVFANKE